MGTLEERLKAYILLTYKSMREYVNTSGVDIPYTTVDGMMKRGIHNASISNVLKLCHNLNISADELAKGNIVPLGNDDPVQEYAKKLSKLSPNELESAMMFIDYLLEKGEKNE